jgi:hypothetical protein
MDSFKTGNFTWQSVSRLELHRSLKQLGKLSGAMFFRIDSDE